jgi:Uma2 family endonuclease
MANAQARPHVTFDDYLAIEEKSEVRYEFIDGVLYAMVGATDRHELIAANVLVALHSHLKGGPRQTFKSDMKLLVRDRRKENVFYPDVFVSCDQKDRETLWRHKPCVIVEVASPSTEEFDRNGKFAAYRNIASLEEYVIVSQDQQRVEVFRRSQGWKEELLGSAATLKLESVKFAMTVADIYDGVPLASNNPTSSHYPPRPVH